jgi:hypothetical protein
MHGPSTTPTCSPLLLNMFPSMARLHHSPGPAQAAPHKREKPWNSRRATPRCSERDFIVCTVLAPSRPQAWLPLCNTLGAHGRPNAVTIIGKIYTAKLRHDEWWDTAVTENWLQTLGAGAAAARHVTEELERQAKSIDLTAKYDELPLVEKQIVTAKVDRLAPQAGRVGNFRLSVKFTGKYCVLNLAALTKRGARSGPRPTHGRR